MSKVNTNQKRKALLPPRFGVGKEVDSFLENISALLAAGIPILEAIKSIRAEVRSHKLSRIIERMEKDIRDGETLSQTLENSGLFSRRVSALIRIGEESGKLIENLKIIAEEERKRSLLSAKIRSAIMYPVFVLGLTFTVGTGIAWFILPKLATVFSQLKISLPTITKILIGFGNFLNNYGVYAIPASFGVFGLLIYLFFFFSKTKIIGEYILFFFPGSKTLLRETEMARFGYLLGTNLSAGLLLTESLYSLAEATSLVRYRHFYHYLAESISEGNSFKKSFSEYKKINRLMPMSIQQLVVAGEQSGSLSHTLLKVSETYEAKIDATTKDLTVMLEPILLVIVWLGVLAVAFAVILPIYSLVGGLNTDPHQAEQSAAPEVMVSQPSEEVTPIVAPTATAEGVPTSMLQILSTSTGYLNVRATPALTSKITTRALPGERYQFTNEKDGWYEIVLSDGKSGWVFGQYVTPIVNEKN